ncbi:salicylate hydroxylase [Russula ochroleuca]|jgi:salicylate hydroxylase|uniref:Salicylate hydroxylase n=1 Tax=Russula ochroleuca TaxID=152965 RepID=A0A9P5JXX4_9AGAM|nr:salicylate hydroxylase [Russula ochroleuca]
MSELEPPSKFHVAICGGGIGGLTLAFALSKSPDISVDVYEAASKFTEIGAGIGVSWRTRQVLKSLGLEEDVIRLLPFHPGEDRGEIEGYATLLRESEAIAVPSVQYRKADQPDGLAMGTTYSRGKLMTLHRAEFHEVLLNRLSSRCRTSPSKRLESYIQKPGAPIMLHFQDGSTATCDILIGADGLKSAVRKTMFQDAATLAESQHRSADAAELRNLIKPRFSGFFSYRTLIPAARLSSISPQHKAISSPVQYLGKNKHMIAYPISRGRFVNIVAFEFHPHEEGTQFDGPWVADEVPSYVQGLFQGWEKEVGDIVQCLDGLKITRWAVNVMPTLPFFAFGNVAILGDAAHAMTPFQGAGAGQAIEDAAILAALLSNELATETTVPQVLEVYSRFRQPLATEVARRSRINGEHFQLRSLAEPADHHDLSSAHLQGIVKQIQDNFEWLYQTDWGAELQRAMSMLLAGLAT